ncbi:MAG: ATP-binding protein [Anaerolineales bacterium]|nr:ATP-binding protein [Anaerolineales bacterium]
MSGPLGAGKTLLAKSMPSILPRMSVDEALEVTKVYSVAGFIASRHTIDEKSAVSRPAPHN